MLNTRPLVFTLIIASVACSACAQLMLKIGMSRSATSSALADPGLLKMLLSIAMNPWVIAGLSLYFFGAVIWLFVLARVQLSFAYPFVGIGFILTMILGKYVMGDDISLQRMLGTLLVVGGVLLIAIDK